MQKLTASLFAAFLIAIISACSNEVPGTAYVIKGDGSVTKAAARDVYLLPFDSVEDLSERFEAFSSEESASALSKYTDNVCSIYSKQQEQKISSLTNALSEYSESCETERAAMPQLFDGEEVTTENYTSQIKAFESEISDKVNALSKYTKSAADALFENAKSKVTTTVIYDKEVFSYRAGIRNDSKYFLNSGTWLHSPVMSLEAGYNGHMLYKKEYVDIDNKDEDGYEYHAIPPGETLDFVMDTRFLISSTERERLIKSGKVKVCSEPKKKSYHTEYPCMNELDVVEHRFFTLKKVEPMWFLGDSDYPYELEKVDFEVTARKTDRKIKQMEKEIAGLSSSLSAAKNLFTVYKSCKSVEEDLNLIRRTSCPVGEGNTAIGSFVSEMNTKFQLDLPRQRFSVNKADSFKAFAETNAVQQTVTNVNGEFLFSEVASGNYVVYSEYEDSFNNLLWLKPIKADGSKIELSNRNASEKLPF